MMNRKNFVFGFTVYLISLCCSANNLDITKELEWGHPQLDDIVYINQNIVGFSEVAESFYLFELNDNSKWQIKSKLSALNPDARAYFYESSMMKVGGDKAVFVDSDGQLSILSVSSNGTLKRKDVMLSNIELSQGTFGSTTTAFRIKGDKLMVVAGYPRHLNIYDVSDINSPSFITSWKIQENLAANIVDIEFDSNNIWLLRPSDLVHLSVEETTNIVTLESALDFNGTTDTSHDFSLGDDLLIIPPLIGNNDYSYIDLTQIPLSITKVNGSVFAGRNEGFQNPRHLGDNKFLLMFSSQLMIVDFSNPDNPKITNRRDAINEEYNYDFVGTTDISDGLIHATTVSKSIHSFSLDLRSKEHGSQLTSAYTFVDDTSEHIVLGTEHGPVVIEKSELTKLINGETTGFEENLVDIGGTVGPECYVEHEQYIYGIGIGHRMWQINKESKKATHSYFPFDPKVARRLNNSTPCLVENDFLFIASETGTLWYVETDNILKTSQYKTIDLSAELDENNDGGHVNINYLASDGDYVYAAANNVIMSFKKSADNKWLKHKQLLVSDIYASWQGSGLEGYDSPYFESLSKSSSGYINGLHILNGYLLATDQQTGIIFQFEIGSGELNLAHFSDGIKTFDMNDSSNTRDLYGIWGSFQWRDYFVAYADYKLQVYALDENNHLNLIRIVETDDPFNEVKVVGDALISLQSSQTHIYSLAKLAQLLNFKIKGSSKVEYALANTSATRAVIVSGGDYGSIEIDGLSVSYTPESNYKGKDHLKLALSNESSLIEDELVLMLFDVDSVNSAPLVDVTTSLATEYENRSVEIAVTVTDLDNDELTYTWAQTSGSVAIELPTAATWTFETPQVSSDEDYGFEVEVSDGNASTTASISIIVRNNQSPIAEIEGPTSVFENELIELVALATDAENDELTYAWNQISGTTQVDVSSTESTLKYTAPQVSTDEEYGFEVHVSDGNSSNTISAVVLIKNVTPKASLPASSSGGSLYYLLMLILVALRIKTLSRFERC
jgi:hypothetical protein